MFFQLSLSLGHILTGIFVSLFLLFIGIDVNMILVHKFLHSFFILVCEIFAFGAKLSLQLFHAGKRLSLIVSGEINLSSNWEMLLFRVYQYCFSKNNPVISMLRNVSYYFI